MKGITRSHHRLAQGATAVLTALAVGVGAPMAAAAPGGGHGEDEGFGNNLAMPVLWAEGADAGVRPTLRGGGPQSADLTLDTTAFETVDGVKVYLQRTENTWQAENAEAADAGIVLTEDGKAPVTFVDWGDNIEVRDPQHPHMLRVETRLLQDVSGLEDPDPADESATAGMTAYSMVKTNDVTGVGEMWGVASSPQAGVDVASAVQADEAFLYTSQACLTIERVDNADTIGWDPATRSWTGDPAIAKCVGEVIDGPGGYGAEVTISGGVTYGYVWRVPDYPTGLYRLTFSLKPESGADITDETELYVSEETEESAEAEEAADSGAPVGNVPVIDPANNLSYIDIGIDYNSGKPSRPVNLSATRDVDATTLTWDAPVDEGSSPITEYMVTGTGAGTVLPEKTVAADQPLTATIDGLIGGEEYLFTVAAVNDSGTGDPATIAVVPRQAPAPAPEPEPPVAPQPQPITGPEPEPEPTRKRTRAQRKVSMQIKTTAGKGKKVRVRVHGHVRSMHGGKWVADKGKVKVYFQKKNKKARVMKKVQAGAKKGYTARFHVHKSGKVFAKVVKNAKHKAAKSRHSHVVMVKMAR